MKRSRGKEDDIRRLYTRKYDGTGEKPILTVVNHPRSLVEQ